MNLLIVTANKSEIDKHLPQLKLLGFAVDVVFDVEGAKKVLATKPVAVVMLSWSLEGTNLPAVYKVISEDHGLPCLIFSEDRSRKVTNLLLTSGIRNVIYPPLSPHGIHRRIQLLMRTHQGRGGQGLKKLGTVRPEAGPAESRRDRKRSLQQSVKKSFEKMAQEGKTAAVPDGAKSCAVLAEIQWPESQGYLVMACDRPFRETGFLNNALAATTR